jgi:outer membrane receptor protein involved in Fe transport
VCSFDFFYRIYNLHDMKKLAVTFFLFFIGFWANAEVDSALVQAKFKGVLQGKVVAKNTKLPIEYAQVVLYQLPDSVLVTGSITGIDGAFLLPDIQAGDYYVVVSFIGFDSKKISNIQFSTNQKIVNLGVVELNESLTDLAVVEIVDEKNLIQYQIDKKVVNVSKKLDAAGGSVANALENTPSIQVDMEGNVSLRGSSNFTVLIDGKPSALSGSDALKQIPASIVENVEIITNPSAKYNPEGTSGIINIVMKKNAQKTSNGIINLSAGTYNKYSGDFSFNYYSKKMNFFMNGNYSSMHSYPFSSLDAWKLFQDTVYYTSQNVERNQVFDPYSISIGFDFTINSKNSLTAKYQFGHWGMDLNMKAKTTESIKDPVLNFYNLSLSSMLISGFYHTGTINFNHDFKKKDHDLVTSLVVSNWQGVNSTDVNELVTNNNFDRYFFANHHVNSQNDENISVFFKTDYTLPISENRNLEAGLQIDSKIVNSEYKIEFEDFATKIWSIPSGGIQNMVFNQDIYSAYVTSSGKIKGIRYLVGLRAEYMLRNLKMPLDNMEYPLNQFNFFPTLHLSRQLKKDRQLQASYSRRVNRPREWSLNPFPVYSDSYISQIGNPNLKPEFTDSYELNFMQHIKKGFFAIEMFYRQTNDAFNQTLTMDTLGIILVETKNMGKNYAYGLEFSTNLSLAKWFNFYMSANLFSYNINLEEANVNIERQSINSDFSANATFKIDDRTRVQLVGFYNAPRLTSQGNQFAMYGANLSVGRDFLKKKLQLTLSIRDVFYSMNYGFITDLPNLYSEFNYRSEYPVIMLQVSYKINDYKRRMDVENTEQNFGGGIM